MRIARVVGTVTASVKDPNLSGHKLLVVDIEDGQGRPIESSVVAIDMVGAGVGESVLVVYGSGARNLPSISGVAVDASIVAIIDEVCITHRKSLNQH